jgi:hypothetical protein
MLKKIKDDFIKKSFVMKLVFNCLFKDNSVGILIVLGYIELTCFKRVSAKIADRLELASFKEFFTNC